MRREIQGQITLTGYCRSHARCRTPNQSCTTCPMFELEGRIAREVITLASPCK